MADLTSRAKPEVRHGTALVLSVYPIKNPVHGGQIRAAQLLNAYKKVFKRVDYVALCNASVYTRPSRTRQDIPTPSSLTTAIQDDPHLEAILIGMAAQSDTTLSERLHQLITRANPTTIILEQPFLGPAVRDILTNPDLQHIQLIYSAHNVEEHMHQSMLEENGHDTATVEAVSWLTTAEAELVRACDGVITVSPDDAAWFTRHGASSVCVAPNGTSIKRKPSRLASARVARTLTANGIDRYVLFVASAHKPNVDGFLSLLSSRLGYLPLGTGIVVVGTLGHRLNLEIKKQDPMWFDFFGHRCFSWGLATNDTLAALIRGSAAIILPITTGEGTNLKTPEALLSGKPIIATTKAFRGFEAYAGRLHVHIADDPQDFRNETARALSAPQPEDFLSRSEDTDVAVEQEFPELLWSATQHTVQSWLVTILGEPSRKETAPNGN